MLPKIHRSGTVITPQELAQKLATDGFKGVVEKAIQHGEKEYRARYQKLLQPSKNRSTGIGRFKTGEAEAMAFLEDVYQNLPAFFKKMIEDAVEEQGQRNGMNEKQKKLLRLELADVIDQEIRLKGRLA